MTLGNFLIDSLISWSYRQDQRRKISFRAYPPRLTWPYARTSSLQMTVTLTVKEGKKYSNHWILRKLRGKTRQHWLPTSWGAGGGGGWCSTKFCTGRFRHKILQDTIWWPLLGVIAKRTGEPLDTTLTEKFNPLLLIDPNNQKHCDQMLLELVL